MKKLESLVASSAGQLVETVIEAQGQHSFAMPNHFFDTNEGRIEECIAFALAKQVRALIIDYWEMPEGCPCFTPKGIRVAQSLKEIGIETFFIVRGSRRSSWSGFLWWANKPLAFDDMKVPVECLAQIGEFGEQVFEIQTGKAYIYSGGDGGMDSLEHALRNWTAFRERDWAKIFALVRGSLA